jgi:hypothetical protein
MTPARDVAATGRDLRQSAAVYFVLHAPLIHLGARGVLASIRQRTLVLSVATGSASLRSHRLANVAPGDLRDLDSRCHNDVADLSLVRGVEGRRRDWWLSYL